MHSSHLRPQSSRWTRRQLHQAIVGALGALALPAVAQRAPALKLGIFATLKIGQAVRVQFAPSEDDTPVPMFVVA